MRYALIIMALLLASCGGSGSGGSASSQDQSPPSNTWQAGGLVGVQQPTGAPLGAFILHQGHDCFEDCSPGDGIDDGMQKLADKLAAAGFAVYKFQMPPLPHTGPVEKYYRPVLDLVAKLSADGTPIFMAGLSGGGWTTTVSTAMDSRILRAYSVSGDMPGYPSAARCAELAPMDNPEFELCNPPLPLEQLYALAGPRLLHVYNFNEGGFFAGHTEPLGYAYVNDPVPQAHYMSEYAIDCIISDIMNHIAGLPTVSELRPQGQEFDTMIARIV